MLGEPEAVVSESLGVLRKIERVLQGVGRSCAERNWSEIENGEALPAHLRTVFDRMRSQSDGKRTDAAAGSCG